MRSAFTVLLICFALLLASCAFLPTEDEPLPAPIARTYEAQAVTAVVTRDDLVLTKSISAAYCPAAQETYNFAVNGILVEGIYVSIGDTVKAGDLLAELNRSEQLLNIEDAKVELRKQQRLLEHARADLSVSRESFILDDLQKKLADLDALEKKPPVSVRMELLKSIREQEKILTDTKTAYTSAVDFAEKQVEVAARKLASLEQEAAERAIYATIDGMVTQVKNIATNYRSIDRDGIITVSDASETAYVVSGADAELLVPGETYQLKIGSDVFDALAAKRDSIASDDTAAVYLYPQGADSGMSSFGTVIVELDRRENTLCLPSKAIKDSNGVESVYYLDENGLRATKPVKTGLRAGGRVEIISGLSEGEEVIVE